MEYRSQGICGRPQLTEEAGTDALFNCTTWGTVKQGNRVCGIATATRWGPVVLLADVVIDASGDGDATALPARNMCTAPARITP